MTEVIKTGKTVDDAIEEACSELGVARDDININIEILDMPQKRLFGKSTLAKVKVAMNEDLFSVKELLQGDAGKSAQQKSAFHEQQKPKADRPVQPTPQHKPAEPKQQKPIPEPLQIVQRKPEDIMDFADLPAGAAAAYNYLSGVIAAMGITGLEYTPYKTENGVEFVISGDDASALIGRRGETMDALQYLSLLVSNRASGNEYCKITLDIGGYRQKRAGTLEGLARRVAGKVKKTRRSQTLEPMNPYERRIVHSAIQGIDGVKSESIGEEPRRRVVVSLEGDNRPYKGGGNRSGGNRNNNNRPYKGGGNDRRYNNDRNDRGGSRPPRPYNNAPSAPPAPPREKTEDEKALEKNLYGKIDI